LPHSAIVNGIPVCALDKHTRLGQQAINRFGRENAAIARFVRDHLPGSRRDGALRLAVFYADGGLTRPVLRWAGAARENLAHLNAIRARLLTRLWLEQREAV
jgi:hypothetical protein